MKLVSEQNKKKLNFVFRIKACQVLITQRCPGGRAGHVPGGTIVLSQERTERSRTIPSFQKKRLERVLKNIGTISKTTERNGTGIA